MKTQKTIVLITTAILVVVYCQFGLLPMLKCLATAAVIMIAAFLIMADRATKGSNNDWQDYETSNSGNARFAVLLVIVAMLFTWLMVYMNKQGAEQMPYNLEFHSEIKDTTVLK